KEKYALGTWDQRVESTSPSVAAPVAFRLEGASCEIVHEFAAANCGKARVTQRIEPEAPGVWRLAATVETLEGPADVVALTFPRLDRVRIGESGLDDAQLRMMSFGHRAIQPGRQALRDATYCGSVVMNWTQVYDREHSLYLGVHDPRGTTTLHGSQASGPEGETVGLYTRRLDEIRPGERAVWETRLAVGPGGWQRGARLYGDWFTATHGPATYPAWLRSSDGWLDLQAENYGPDFRFSRLNDWLTTARAAGLDWVQVWGQFAYDGGPCCAAWYGLSPLYGGADGWRTAARDFRQRGGHLGGYYLYHTFDRLPLFFDTYLGRFAKAEYGNVPWDSPEFQHGIQLVEDPAGTLTPHSPSEAELATWRDKIAEHQRLRAAGERAPAVMWWQEAYIANPAWRDYLADWVADRYVKDYGVDTAYLDVLCTGDASIDYDPRRGHNGDGSWGEGRRLLAKEVYERGRAANPEFALTGEGLGDLPGLYAAQLCSGVYYGHRNIVRYTFPDRVLFHGMANAGSAGGPLERWVETFREAMRFDLVGQPSALPMALLTLLRHATPSIWTATFQDTIGLEPSDPRVAARRHDLTSGPGGSVLTVTNPAGVPANLRLDPPLAGRPAFRIDLDGT
ncbi:MAG: hypothetical protein HUU35_18980, partial [Armatimonadetes bacterium]|nr:hypothetical protein [Armatimonadota bacterium]